MCVDLGPATTPWEITPAFAHLNTCRSTEATTAWVGKGLGDELGHPCALPQEGIYVSELLFVKFENEIFMNH